MTLDWDALGADLDEHGVALGPVLLDPDECAALAAMYDDDSWFRSTIDMRRHGFGSGEYKYFRYPLPEPIAALRPALYEGLVPVANRWAEWLGTDPFPPTLDEFLQACHAAGQTRPTPLVLRYGPGDHNALHQDVYGDIGFPFQVLVVLTPANEYEGGEFLLVTQRPRAQSIGEVVPAAAGQLVVFPNRVRPMKGSRGYYRANVRHGVSRLRRGRRHSLGIIFHDAR